MGKLRRLWWTFDARREEEEMARNAKQREALSERGNNAREVERNEMMLKRQLSKWTERTERLREQASQKAQEANEKMHELRAVHHRLTQEHTEKGKETCRQQSKVPRARAIRCPDLGRGRVKGGKVH